LRCLYGALHTGRNLTDDLVTTTAPQLHTLGATIQNGSKKYAFASRFHSRRNSKSLVLYLL